MAPSHEKGRRGTTRASDDEFVLYLQGVPAHCRWQELKDFVRQTAMHIRQAVVYDDPNGYPTGIGQIIVKNEDEAWRTFRKLATTGWDGQVLTVTLAKASAPTKPISGPKQSPSASRPRFSFGMGNGSSNRTVPSDSVATRGYMPAPPPLMNYIHAYPASTPSWAANPEAHPFSPSPAVFPFNHMEYQYYPTSSMNPPQHMYGAAIMDATTMFIHTVPYYHQGGVIATGGGYPDPTTSTAFALAAAVPSCCSVIIDNLHRNIDVQTLKDHFHTTARAVVEHCEIVKTPPSPHAKDKEASSYAMATFPSTEEATKAVSLCNGTMLSGNRIVVRFDPDSNRIFSTTGGGGSLHADEDWTSTTTPLSASSPFFQPPQPPQPPPPPSSLSSPSAFSGEGWNLFLSTTASSPASSSPPSCSSATSYSVTSPFAYKNAAASTPTSSSSSSSSLSPSNSTSQCAASHSNNKNRPRRDSGKELTCQNDAEKTTMASAKQPLVVNGSSMSGRAKM